RSCWCMGSGVEREVMWSSDRAREEANRAETVRNFRLLCTQGMAGTESCRAIASQCWPGVPRTRPRLRVIEEGNSGAGKDAESRFVVTSAVERERVHVRPVRLAP